MTATRRPWLAALRYYGLALSPDPSASPLADEDGTAAGSPPTIRGMKRRQLLEKIAGVKQDELHDIITDGPPAWCSYLSLGLSEADVRTYLRRHYHHLMAIENRRVTDDNIYFRRRVLTLLGLVVAKLWWPAGLFRRRRNIGRPAAAAEIEDGTPLRASRRAPRRGRPRS